MKDFGPRYYRLDGHKVVPCTLMEWARMFDNFAGRRVAYTEIRPDLTVSTVFLGLNHNFGDGPPLLFETMAFGAEKLRSYTHKGRKHEYMAADDIDMRRYSTWEEAVTGHEQMVAELRKRAAGENVRRIPVAAKRRKHA